MADFYLPDPPRSLIETPFQTLSPLQLRGGCSDDDDTGYEGDYERDDDRDDDDDEEFYGRSDDRDDDDMATSEISRMGIIMGVMRMMMTK